MDIIFYKSTNEVSSFPKSLTDGVTISGTLRSECDILNPVIEFTGIGVDIPYNYCYIPTFKRYYFITEAISIRNDILELSMHVDVLQSWANDILKLGGVINRNEFDFNPYIVDDLIIMDKANTSTSDIYYPSGNEIDMSWDKYSYVITVAASPETRTWYVNKL